MERMKPYSIHIGSKFAFQYYEAIYNTIVIDTQMKKSLYQIQQTRDKFIHIQIIYVYLLLKILCQRKKQFV